MKRFHLDYTQKRLLIVLFSILLLLIIYFFKDASTWLRVLSAIATLVFFYSVDHFFNIGFRKRHYAFMIIIVIFSFLLSPLYFIYPNYDKFQHFFQPMLLCSLIFYMINKLHLELKWKLVFTFFVVFAILGIFEIGEFTLDSFFNLKLQGVFLRDEQGLDKFNLLMDPLSDTMVDLVYGLLGAGIYCVGYAFVLRKKLYHNIFREV
ncbi:MAG: hypothetical protein WCK29_02630 [archaeon]